VRDGKPDLLPSKLIRQSAAQPLNIYDLTLEFTLTGMKIFNSSNFPSGMIFFRKAR
jgi:hypothetical protein